MDLSQYGGSTLETSALERALKRRKDRDKNSNRKPRERLILERANSIRRDEERVVAIKPAAQPLILPVAVKKPAPPLVENENDEGETDDVITAEKTPPHVVLERMHSMKREETTQNLEIHVDSEEDERTSPLGSPLSPSMFPPSPIGNTPTNMGGRSLWRRADSSATNRLGQPLLDSDEVKKYFGYSALNAFSEKVSFVNKQKHNIVSCPPINLNSVSSNSLSSASRSRRSKSRGASSSGPLCGSRGGTTSRDSSRGGQGARPGPSYRPASRNRKAVQKKLLEIQSNKHDQLISAQASASRSGSPNGGRPSGQGGDAMATFLQEEDSSLMSDVSGLFAFDQSLFSSDPLREKRDMMLHQVIFSDKRDDQDEQLDMQKHTIEASRLEQVQASPRSAYIMGCLSDNLNPRGTHIVRKRISDELHLEHYGMGDELIEHLATALQFLPHLTYVNIADNNLTDWGLVHVLSTIVNVKHLLILDMSYNKIGSDCAEALAAYLHGNPLLQQLILQKTDIDDFEGEMFVKAIHNNTHLTDLDLSRNDLGNQEVLNSVRPNTTTAPEQLGDLLRQKLCPLRKLTLAWNVIRLESAASLAQSLAVNESLIFLDLSYNGIGPDGGRIIGESLFENHTLQTLLLANNNIDAVSCFIICAAVQQNYSLTHLCMDGNPVGEIGAKSLMNIPTSLGSRLTLTAAKCNVNFRSSGDNNWFDEEDPCGKYCLDLSDSFARAVAFKILSIAANHYSYDIKKCAHSPKKDSREKTPIVLRQAIIRDKTKYMTPKEEKILQNLHRLMDSAKDIDVLEELFVEYDFNQSGTLEHFELKVLLDDMGMKLADNQIENAMAFIDIDKSGSIDMNEFVEFMEQYREDVEERIRDMTEGVVMSEQPLDEDSEDDDTATSQDQEAKDGRYIPPRTGFLHMELIDTYEKKAKFNILTEVDCNNIINIAQKIGNVTKMIGYSLHSAKIRFNEALKFFGIMFQDIGNKAEVLFILLPRMMFPMEARILVSRVTNEDPVEIDFVRQKLGNALLPIYGLPCGYYSMDLAKMTDRICLVRLFEVGIGVMARRRKRDPLGIGMVGDTSQSRNWSPFRNEVYKGELFKVLPDVLSPIPREGLLEFDFVVHELPPVGTHIMADEKLVQILINTTLLTVKEKEANFRRLRQDHLLANRCLGANGKVLYMCDKYIAADVGEAQGNFMFNVYDRSEYFQEGIKREAIKVDFKCMPRKQTMLSRLISLTNADELMGAEHPDPFMDENHNDPSLEALTQAETFEEKFKEFINRPLGEHQQKLLEKYLTSTAAEEKQFTKQDDISEICSHQMTRTEIYVHRKNKRVLPPVSPPGTPPSAPPSPGCKAKPRSRKGEMVHLPSIVVMKDNRPVVLPAISFAKEEEKVVSAMDEFEVKAEENHDGHAHAPLLGALNTRAAMLSSAHLVLGASGMSAEYNDHVKRVKLQTQNRRRMRELAESPLVSRQAKASKLLAMLLDFVGIYWVRCRHVANIMYNFPIGSEVKTEFYGTYRVEFVVTIFSKIIDIHNFDLILKELEPFEQGCVYCRLGWLNLFNPTRPERSYELNMEVWEERMVAKALLYLADVEDGENVGNADFRWSRDMDRMPGWMVTKPWMSENTMQRKGILSLTYISADVDYQLVPDISARKSLLSMVLSSEDLMVPEPVKQSALIRASSWRAEMGQPAPGPLASLVGPSRMLAEADRWAAYFYGDKNVNSRITNVTKKEKTLL